VRTKASAIPLLCGLSIGVVLGSRPMLRAKLACLAGEVAAAIVGQPLDGDRQAIDRAEAKLDGSEQIKFWLMHVTNLRAINVTPHAAQNDSITSTGKHRRSAIDARTTRHQGYGMSQSCRTMTECIFGWGKQHGTMRKTKHRGIAAGAAGFLLNLIAYNLI